MKNPWATYSKKKDEDVEGVKFSDPIINLSAEFQHLSEICHRQDKQLAEQSEQLIKLRYRLWQVEQMHWLDQKKDTGEYNIFTSWLQKLCHKGVKQSESSSGDGR